MSARADIARQTGASRGANRDGLRNCACLRRDHATSSVFDGQLAREPEAPVALYRLEVKVVSRGKQGASMVAGAAYRSGSCLVEHDHGRSAVAASAHLAGVALEDQRGVVHDFR